jgi:hypothetical protein
MRLGIGHRKSMKDAWIGRIFCHLEACKFIYEVFSNRFQIFKNPLLFVEHGCTTLNSEATQTYIQCARKGTGLIVASVASCGPIQNPEGDEVTKLEG